MFIVKIWGLPSVLTEEQLRSLFNQILDLAKNTSGLKIYSERDILVLYPSDRMIFGLGVDLFVEIYHTELSDLELDKIEHGFMRNLGDILIKVAHPSHITMVSPTADGDGLYTRISGVTMVE
jgi:hypothetical protein